MEKKKKQSHEAKAIYGEEEDNRRHQMQTYKHAGARMEKATTQERNIIVYTYQI